MASKVPDEPPCNTQETDEETIAFRKKRSRRVSFADREITSVHIFNHDDDYEVPPDSTPRPASEREKDVLGLFRDLVDSDDSNCGNDDVDEEDDVLSARKSFLRPMESPSPGGSSTVGSAISNDENFFGTVSANFIQSGRLSDSATSDDNHDITIDLTAFSMHFRSIVRSESRDLNTSTGVPLAFEEKTPCQATMPSEEKRLKSPSPVPINKFSGGNKGDRPPTNKGRKASSRDVLSSMDTCLAKVKLTVGEMRNKFEDTEKCIEELDSMREELKGELQGALKKTIDGLMQRNDALEAQVVALKGELEQLRGEFAALRAAIVAGPALGARVEVPKPLPFAGSRSAKDVDNFIWGMEQYFRVALTVENAKVSTASMYLTDVALLWWRRRSDGMRRGESAVNTWDEFVGELRQQFKSEYAEDEARGQLLRLIQRGRVRDYCREFSELLLMIPDMSEKEALFSFMDGLKPWVKTELQRRGVQGLSRAIAVAESLIEFERTKSPRSWNKCNNKGDGGSNSLSEEEGNEKPTYRNSKTNKTAKYKGKEKKSFSCYFCDGQHRVNECPMRKKLAAIVQAVEQSEGESSDDGQQ